MDEDLQKKCSNCNASAAPGVLVCGECGQPFVLAEEELPRRESSEFGLGQIVSGLVLTMLLGFLILDYVKHQEDSSSATAPAVDLQPSFPAPSGGFAGDSPFSSTADTAGEESVRGPKPVGDLGVITAEALMNG